jgi:photosystem II stability/assembly factor-like uncharacterized protein
LHSIDGEHWTHQSSQTLVNLNAIFGTPDGAKLWIVGDAGTILHSSDGEHWNTQSTTFPYSLRSIFGAQDGKELWTVGDFGTILHSTDGEHWTVERSLLHSTDGKHWTADRTVRVPFITFHSIFGTPDCQQLWIVGDAGAILHSTDRKNWAIAPSPTKVNLFSVFGTADGRQLWASGDAGTIIHSVDNGLHWAIESLNLTLNLRSVSGTPEGKQLWAVGESATIGGKIRAILHSTDTKKWSIQYSDNLGGTLNAVVSTADGKQVWTVGTKLILPGHDPVCPGLQCAAIFHSIDGEHWVARKSPTNDVIFYSLFGTPDGKQLWAVGEHLTQKAERSAAIFHSADGENWEIQYSSKNAVLWSVFGTADGKNLWAVGGSGRTVDPNGREVWTAEHKGLVLHSGDGRRWTSQSSGTDAVLYAGFVNLDGRQVWAVGGPAPTTLTNNGTPTNNDIDGATILRSTDGERWSKLGVAEIQDLRVPKHLGRILTPVSSLGAIFGTPNAKELWAVGAEGAILHSTDGQHWAVQDWEGRKEEDNLNAIFGTSDGKRLWAVGGGDQDLDRSTGLVGRHCTILNSTDGAPWVAQSCGTDKPLYSIWGTSDGGQLWAAGEDGIILHSTDGEHWAIFEPDQGFSDYTLQSIFGTADGTRLWVTGSSPQWFTLQANTEPPSLLPTLGIVFMGQRSFHAPYVESARLDSFPNGARLELNLQLPTGRKEWVDVKFEPRNEFDFQHNRPAATLLPGRIKPNINFKTPEKQSFDFDPSEVAIGRGERAHFDVTLKHGLLEQHFYYTATYDPFHFFHENYRWITLIGPVLFLFLCFTIFLFVKPLWNLYLYRRFRLDKIGDISIPGVGDVLKIMLRTLAMLPWFVKHHRTLDAWIERNRQALESVWSNDAAQMPSRDGRTPELYVQLPIVIGNPSTGPLFQQPIPDDFTQLMREHRFHLQIVGPGGAGKTTLARQIGRWALDGSIRSGKDKHKLIPIWIDEELSEAKSVSKVVRGKLYSSLPNEELENDFATLYSATGACSLLSTDFPNAR